NKQHLDLHIIPFIGATKLNKLTVPAVRTFETTLRTNGRSPALTRMVLSSLGALVGDAQERGLALRNPVRGLLGSAARRRADTKPSWLSGWTYPHPLRSGRCSMQRRVGGTRSSLWLRLPACEAQNCAACAGRILPLVRQPSPCASGLTPGGNRQPQVRSRLPHDPRVPDGRESASRMEARLPQGR